IVRLVREQPPEHCILKIKSFSVLQQALSNSKIDHIDSTEFKAGGYTWVLSIYPNGNKEEGGDGHVSLYVALIDKLDSVTLLYASLRFFIYDQIRDNYLSFIDSGDNLFYIVKTARGIPKALPVESFTDASNGFLVNDCCTFGAGVILRDGKIQRSIMSPLKTECEMSYTWKIENFSDFSNLMTSPDIKSVSKRGWKGKRERPVTGCGARKCQ
ncbi:Ubiquitin carboxyl-terminal hydrolase 12, partial [Bienertia sinuspersici]